MFLLEKLLLALLFKTAAVFATATAPLLMLTDVTVSKVLGILFMTIVFTN